MNEYTFDSVIINPFKEGIESLIGKEVYFQDNPCLCLKNANDKSPVMSGILVEICRVSINPFLIKKNDGIVQAYPCIIEKKEPNPKYEPFKSVVEFLNGYSHVETKNLDDAHRYLYSQGMWLKEKGTDDSDTFCMVHELWKDGVFAGHADVVLTEDGVNTDFISWHELYMGYTFLDGSPCGKKAQG